jgi:hypothetical protein
MYFTREELWALFGSALILAFCAAFYILTMTGTLKVVPSIYDAPPPAPTPTYSESTCETIPGPQMIIYCTHS